MSRVERFIEALKKNETDMKILVVTHNGIAKVFDWYFREHEKGEEFGGIDFGNAEAREYEV